METILSESMNARCGIGRCLEEAIPFGSKDEAAQYLANLDEEFKDGFKTYEGEIEPSESGEFRFTHYYSGYQKIFIDGKSVYTEDLLNTGSKDQEIWRTAWNPNARKFAVNLEAGKRYSIKIEWKPDGGEAYCGLRAYAPVAQEEQNKLSVWSEMNQQMDVPTSVYTIDWVAMPQYAHPFAAIITPTVPEHRMAMMYATALCLTIRCLAI